MNIKSPILSPIVVCGSRPEDATIGQQRNLERGRNGLPGVVKTKGAKPVWIVLLALTALPALTFRMSTAWMFPAWTSRSPKASRSSSGAPRRNRRRSRKEAMDDRPAAFFCA
jgi:hypothetical protein